MFFMNKVVKLSNKCPDSNPQTIPLYFLQVCLTLNMEKLKNKGKHFTSMEKKLFLEILKRYKDIIEIKKSDSTTLKDKDAAWTEICNEYNASQVIMQERNVQQLKKFWANLKQNQRDALTKERQERMATGGGPFIKSVEIDPDVSVIAPNLMKTAPAIYSCNVNDEELIKRETLVIDCIADGDQSNVELVLENEIINSEISFDDSFNNNSDKISNKENISSNISKKKEMHAEERSLQSFKTCSTDIIQSNFLTTESKENNQREKLLKRGKRAISSNDYESEALKKQRIQKLFEQEVELNLLKMEHEKKMFTLKEQHLMEVQKHELRAVIATAKTAELQLELLIKKKEKL